MVLSSNTQFNSPVKAQTRCGLAGTLPLARGTRVMMRFRAPHANISKPDRFQITYMLWQEKGYNYIKETFISL